MATLVTNLGLPVQCRFLWCEGGNSGPNTECGTVIRWSADRDRDGIFVPRTTNEHAKISWHGDVLTAQTSTSDSLEAPSCLVCLCVQLHAQTSNAERWDYEESATVWKVDGFESLVVAIPSCWGVGYLNKTPSLCSRVNWSVKKLHLKLTKKEHLEYTSHY